jgi:hypothetical protein
MLIMKRAILILVAIVACVIVGLTWLWPASAPVPVLPKGEQTLTGVLNRAPLSLTRRGTHVLTQEGKNLSMVESATVSLQHFEGQTVTLHGTFEPNTDPQSLPVLVVRSIDTHPETDRPEAIQSLNLAFTVPSDWVRAGTEPNIHFTASGSAAVILQLTVAPGTVLPTESNLAVGSKLAKRKTDPKTGSATVLVQLDSSRLLVLSFIPTVADPVAAGDRLSSIIRSLKFGSVSPAATTGPTGSGSVLGSPCGGTAGILCPKGYICQITDAAHGVGSCAPLPKQS